MLSDEQQNQFYRRGYLKLSGVVDATELATMRAAIWDLLAERGADRDDTSTWPQGHVWQLQTLRSTDPRPDHSQELMATLEQLFGQPVSVRTDWAQALVMFPTQTNWRVSSGPWHLDHEAYPPQSRITGVNVFLLADDLLPQGGATQVLEHSPALVREFTQAHPELAEQKTAVWRRALLQSTDYLKRLSDAGDDAADRNDALMQAQPVRVVELTGVAGDAFICHPLLLHAPPEHNAQNRPRMMRTLRVFA